MFKAKTSRYTKKEEVFSVPCAYVREVVFAVFLSLLACNNITGWQGNKSWAEPMEVVKCHLKRR